MKIGLCDLAGDGCLRTVRMIRAGVYLEFLENLATEAVVRNHALDGTLHESLGVLGPDGRRGEALLATAPTGEGGHHLVSFLVASEHNFVGIDHDDEVTGVEVRRKCRLVFAALNVGRRGGHLAEHGAVRVDDMPLARLLIHGTIQLIDLWQICLHPEPPEAKGAGKLPKIESESTCCLKKKSGRIIGF